MQNSIQRWIEIGYETFAKEGPEGIKVEVLARKLKLNKSGFYHYFIDREVFIERILEHHTKEHEAFCNEVSAINNFDPDYFLLLIKYQNTLFTQINLCRHSDNQRFKETFDKLRLKNERLIGRAWSEFIGLPNNPELALEIWYVMRYVVYMHLNPRNISLPYLRSVVRDVTDIIDRLKVLTIRAAG